MDDQQARELLQSAEHGDPDAIYEVACNYYSGKNGFEQDDDKAFYWTKRAVEADPSLSVAWDLLGRCYTHGVGVDVNAAEAIAAYKKAVELGNQSSLFLLAEELYFSDKEAEKQESLVWLKKACNVPETKDDAEALLGHILVNKELETNNPGRGELLLSRLADSGDAESALALADAYWQGKTLAYDIEKIVRYYTIALDGGVQRSWRAYYYGGLAHFKGAYGVKKDYQLARKALEDLIPYWEDNSAIQNYVIRANAILGCMCCEGEGGPVDGVLGERCLLAAVQASSNDPDDEQIIQDSLLNLGKYYYDGKGVPQDRNRAAHYFQQAAARGNQTAINNLKTMTDFSFNDYRISNSIDYVPNSSEQPTDERHFSARRILLGFFVGGAISMFVGNLSPILGILIFAVSMIFAFSKR